MSLTADQMKEWVEDLMKKIRALEDENKSLKLQILEFKTLRKTQDMSNEDGIDGSSVEANPLLEKQSKLMNESDYGSRDQKMSAAAETTNPFQLEPIVKYIMHHVSPMDLLKCRQVCKLWKIASRKDVEERITFVIDNEDGSQIRLFVDYAQNSFPMFRNLKWNFQTAVKWKDIHGLFPRHGKYLHKFQLNFGGPPKNLWNDDLFEYLFDSLEEIRELRIVLVCRMIHVPEGQMPFPRHVKRTLPYLTILNLGLDCGGCSMNHEIGKTQIFNDILEVAPNLQTLYWQSWNHGNKEKQDGLNHFIRSLVQVNPPKLENLFIRSVLPPFLVTLIRTSQLKLKQFTFPNSPQ